MYFSVLLPLMSSQVLKVYQALFFKLIALKHIHTYIYTQICKSYLMRFYISFLGSFRYEVMLIVFLWLNWHQRCHRLFLGAAVSSTNARAKPHPLSAAPRTFAYEHLGFLHFEKNTKGLFVRFFLKSRRRRFGRRWEWPQIWPSEVRLPLQFDRWRWGQSCNFACPCTSADARPQL